LIRRILKDGESIDYSITEFFEMREDASAEECRLIALYGRADIGTGHLLNRTDGGDGARGLLPTDEERAKMSASANDADLYPSSKALENGAPRIWIR